MEISLKKEEFFEEEKSSRMGISVEKRKSSRMKISLKKGSFWRREISTVGDFLEVEIFSSRKNLRG